MIIKTKNNMVDIPNWLMVITVLVVDSMYSNHCRKKAIVKYFDKTMHSTNE